MNNIQIIHGDCLEVMRGMPDNSFDAVVTDPPYGLGDPPDVIAMMRDWLDKGYHDVAGKGFMGKEWDKSVPQPIVWREVFRVLKPGGYLLAFAGTRTQDLMAMGLRFAGFEVRDMIAWLYGSGFPKSLDVSKAIDRAAGVEREVVGSKLGLPGYSEKLAGEGNCYGDGLSNGKAKCAITSPATDAAKRWQGWGTALKPAMEPITVARKPFKGSVAANVLAHGTGAINVDGCRVGDEVRTASPTDFTPMHGNRFGDPTVTEKREKLTERTYVGRWPANVIHDGSDEVLAAFPEAPGQLMDIDDAAPSEKTSGIYGVMRRAGEPSADSINEGVVGFRMKPGARRLDSGSAARFFYCAKADSGDRHDGTGHSGPQFTKGSTLRDAENVGRARKGNHHPTVKPTDLMRYLVRLVTPPGGRVLDPYGGSGSTAKGCELEGFDCTLIERELEYVEIARRRVAADAPLFAAAMNLTGGNHA